MDPPSPPTTDPRLKGKQRDMSTSIAPSSTVYLPQSIQFSKSTSTPLLSQLALPSSKPSSPSRPPSLPPRPDPISSHLSSPSHPHAFIPRLNMSSAPVGSDIETYVPQQSLIPSGNLLSTLIAKLSASNFHILCYNKEKDDREMLLAHYAEGTKRSQKSLATSNVFSHQIRTQEQRIREIDASIILHKKEISSYSKEIAESQPPQTCTHSDFESGKIAKLETEMVEFKETMLKKLAQPAQTGTHSGYDSQKIAKLETEMAVLKENMLAKTQDTGALFATVKKLQEVLEQHEMTKNEINISIHHLQEMAHHKLSLNMEKVHTETKRTLESNGQMRAEMNQSKIQFDEEIAEIKNRIDRIGRFTQQPDSYDTRNKLKLLEDAAKTTSSRIATIEGQRPAHVETHLQTPTTDVLNDVLNLRKDEIKINSDKIAVHETRIRTIEENVNRCSTTLHSSLSRLGQFELALSKFKQTETQNLRLLDTLSTAFKSLETRYNNITTEELYNRIARKMFEILPAGKLQQEFTALKEEICVFSSFKTVMSSEVGKLINKIDQLERTSPVSPSQQDQLKTEVAGLNKRVVLLESNALASDERLAGLNHRVIQLESTALTSFGKDYFKRLAELNHRVTQLESNTSTSDQRDQHKTEISGLNEKLTQVLSTVILLQKNISSYSLKFSPQQLEHLNQKIESLLVPLRSRFSDQLAPIVEVQKDNSKAFTEHLIEYSSIKSEIQSLKSAFKSSQIDISDELFGLNNQLQECKEAHQPNDENNMGVLKEAHDRVIRLEESLKGRFEEAHQSSKQLFEELQVQLKSQSTLHEDVKKLDTMYH